MDLDDVIITTQQETGLAAFRAEQEEREHLKDTDFLDFYIIWQHEKGYFNDAYLIAPHFKTKDP